ncbi:MAG TPA: histidine kinase [Miltoncostaeaceae bacterium]|nr:histidine kinase [Miltoncostaeaceae bacterium]
MQTRGAARSVADDGPRAADINLLRRADAAGQRLFRQLVASRIAWAAVSETSRLVAVDVVGFSLRATGCAHPQPCHLHHCFDRLEMKAVLGNRGRHITGARLPLEGCDAALAALVGDEEGLGALIGVPVSFGGEVRGVLHCGLRRDGVFGDGVMEALGRVCTYAGAALAAARDRARVEEVAANRERRRLARALHDEFGQRLFTIGMTAQKARASARSGGADLVTHLSGLEQQIAGASAAFRATLRSLDRPAAPGGAIAVKLREDVAAFTQRTGVPAHLLVLGEPGELDGGREALLVSVAQEGLRNVERHAGATEVVLTLAFSAESVELVIQDDGAGVQGGPPTGGSGLGLGILREEIARVGGEARLRRSEDTGSTMRARIPLA